MRARYSGESRGSARVQTSRRHSSACRAGPSRNLVSFSSKWRLTHIDSPILRVEGRISTLATDTGPAGRAKVMGDLLRPKSVGCHRVEPAVPGDVRLQRINHEISVGRADRAYRTLSSSLKSIIAYRKDIRRTITASHKPFLNWWGDSQREPEVC